ncbi:MAG TPA: CdaR family protein [Thermodesulfovibrionales bacterium]|nr:CdaR family protein [Thermodesulfovibrionales bacterium]
MIRRLLFGNLSLKLSALLLAIFLWFFVSSRGQTEIALEVPIQYINLPAGIEISKSVAKSASIVIRGHESLLKNVRQGDVTVSVDVAKAKEGEGVFAIRNDDVRLPPTVTVVKIEPSSAKVVFERTVTKRVAVRPVITGEPERGSYVKSVEVKPADVVIEGAQSEVGKVGYLRTEPVDITGLNEDFRQETEIALSGRNIRTKTDKVDVNVRIARRGK